jgi:uncharacterized integral membrane protein
MSTAVRVAYDCGIADHDEPREAARRRLDARLVVAAVAAVCAVIFVVQNSDRIRLRFLFIDVTTRLWVGLVVSLLLGALLGQAFGALRRRRRD